MAQMTVRNLDDGLYERLKARARANHRSVEAEVRAILDRELRTDRAALVAETSAFRDGLAGRYTGDSTADIRADRDRR